MTDQDYVLGQSEKEYRRLARQARFLRPWTEHFFRSAGIGPGMSVLDLGSGVGDVSLLAAEMVGPGGHVLGIDRDAGGVDRARQRAAENACSDFVQFQTANLDDFESEAPFDAVIGRYILLYQPDAAATLRRLKRFLRPGGIVVFHEVDFTNQNPSWPECVEWDQYYALAAEIFRRAGSPPDFGRRLGPTFLDAGLPWPVIEAIGAAGGGKGSYLYSWLAEALLSVAPKLGQLGVVLADGMRLDDTLASRIEETVVKAGSQILGPIQYGAWTRNP